MSRTEMNIPVAVEQVKSDSISSNGERTSAAIASSTQLDAGC